MKVGMIGFGRLGKLIAKNLAQDTDLVIYDIEDYKREISSLGAKAGTLEEVCSCPVVIPFVPMSALEDLLKEMAPLLSSNSLVIDVCSVKSLPVEWMKEHLPDSIEILGTHPMFGPDSARNTLFGCKIVLCPVRIKEEKTREIRAYLETHGLKVIEATPEEHDKQIAHSLLLTHFIGRSLMEFEAKSLDIDTKGYRRLMKILETVENDTWQLFEDMNRYNPYAEETRKDFMNSLRTIDQKVRS
jgi:prephenate dehydrogenase